MMKFFNSKSEQEIKEQKQALRTCLSSFNTELFPNGLFGQISIGYEKKAWRITLPVKLGQYEQEVLSELQNVVSEPIHLDYEATKAMQPKVPNVKLIIAVASGKGGVGKSTVTTNLAVTLASLGHKVGIVDADIYGPSIPMMFGKEGENITSSDGKTMKPIFEHQVWINSIGFLVPKEKATVWRGPMASRALAQLINETQWPELDVLLVDMPPGTGDIQLTMSQTIPCDGAVIVTTPQNVALADAEKGINMFEKVNIPVLGVIENMSQFICDECGKSHYLFGQKGGEQLAESHNLKILGQLPLEIDVRECGDNGTPVALKQNNQYAQLAFSLMMQASKQTESVITLG